MALESVLFIKTLVIKKLHLKQVKSLECKESDKTFEFVKQVSTETCHLQLVKRAAQ